MTPIWVAAASMFVFSKIGITQGKAYIIPENNKDKTQYNVDSLNHKIKSIQIEFLILDWETKIGIPNSIIHFFDLNLNVKTNKKGSCQVNIPIVQKELTIEINSIKYNFSISSEKDREVNIKVRNRIKVYRTIDCPSF